jgi:hypothetical protein
MKKRAKKSLRAAGWKVGTVTDFLGLSKRDDALVEVEVARIKARRHRPEAARRN